VPSQAQGKERVGLEAHLVLNRVLRGCLEAVWPEGRGCIRGISLWTSLIPSERNSGREIYPS